MSTLSDLDRCVHGRHSIDRCLGCPDGVSTGNLFLRNGQRIGTDHGGEPIYVQTDRVADRQEPPMVDPRPLFDKMKSILDRA